MLARSLRRWSAVLAIALVASSCATSKDDDTASPSSSGDTGAKHLIGEHEDEVVEVDLPDEAPLLDVDTPEALSRLAGVAA